MQKQTRLNSTGRRAPDTRDLSPVSKCCSFSQTNQLRLCCTTVASTQNLFPNKRAVGIFVAFSMMSHRTGTFHDFPESFSRDLAKMCFWSSAFEKQFAFHPLPHPPAPSHAATCLSSFFVAWLHTSQGNGSSPNSFFHLIKIPRMTLCCLLLREQKKRRRFC